MIRIIYSNYACVLLSSFTHSCDIITISTSINHNMNQHNLTTAICQLDGKVPIISQYSNFHSESNEGKNWQSLARFSLYFAVSICLGSTNDRKDNSGLFNFANMRDLAKKCFQNKGKDVKDFGRDKLVKLGILKNPSIFGSTIVDIVKLDGKEEKVPEFLQFTLRNS